MRLFALFCAFAVSSALAASMEELPAADLVQSQMTKIVTLITNGDKTCQAAADQLTAEINKRQLTITKYEAEIKTVRTKFELSQSQLKQELVAIQQVKTMVSEVITTGFSSSSSSVSAANSKITALEQSSVKMAGVLRNIIASVQSVNSTGVPVNIDLSEVITLITKLETNIQSALQVDSVTSEEKSYTEKITVEKGVVAELQSKLDAGKAECQKKLSDYTEVLSVLKLIEAKFENVTIPNCQAAIDDQTKNLATCQKEKETLTQKVTESDSKIKEYEKLTPAHEQCKTDLNQCQTANTKVVEQQKTIDQLQSQLKDSQTQSETLRQQVVKTVSEKTVVEAKLTETTQEVQRLTELSQCGDAKTLIQTLENRVHQLSIKAELGDKCAANFKAQQIEKIEMLKQLEKLSVVSRQLENCQFDSAKSQKECSVAAEQASQSHIQSLEKLSEETRRLNQEIARLQEQAKCSSERSVIEKYEKELVTVKTETRTVVTQVESDVSGCHAELESYKAARSEDEQKINQYFSQVATLQQQLQIAQSEHSNCLEVHGQFQTACQAQSADLASCRSQLQTQLTQVTAEQTVINQLKTQQQTLISEVHNLETIEVTLKTEIKTMTTTISTEEGKIVVLTKQVSEHDAAEKEAASKVDSLKSDITSQSNKIATVQRKLSETKTALAGEEAGNDKLEQEVKELEADLAKAQAAKVAAEAELSKSQSKVANLRKFKATALKHLADAKDVIASSDKKIDSLNAEIASATQRRTELLAKLSAADAQVDSIGKAWNATKAELNACHIRGAELETRLNQTLVLAECNPQKATISELKKHGYSLRVELRAAQSIKEQLVRKVAGLEGKIKSWIQLNEKLKEELNVCADSKAGCHASVKALKNQMLSHLRRIKGHVSTVARLEERLAAAQTELSHTRKQWHNDRTTYKQFKDNFLVQMAKLISLAKDSKRKFDVARVAGKNELKVQDAQWGVCRKEVLNYERILGAGVVKAEKEKMKAFLATRRYAAVKSSADAAVAQAQKKSGATPETREQQKAEQTTHQNLEKLAKQKLF